MNKDDEENGATVAVVTLTLGALIWLGFLCWLMLWVATQ